MYAKLKNNEKCNLLVELIESEMIESGIALVWPKNENEEDEETEVFHFQD